MSYHLKFVALSAAAAALFMQNRTVPTNVQDAVNSVLGAKAWPGETAALVEADGHNARSDGDWASLNVKVTMFQVAALEPVQADPPAPVHDEDAGKSAADGLPPVESAEQPTHVDGDPSALPEVEPAPEPLPAEEVDATVSPATTINAEAEDPAATVPV